MTTLYAPESPDDDPHDFADGSVYERQAAEIERLRAENARLEGEIEEAYRRRDAWKERAEGWQEMRDALAEKVKAQSPSFTKLLLLGELAAVTKELADLKGRDTVSALAVEVPEGTVSLDGMAFRYCFVAACDGDHLVVPPKLDAEVPQC